MNEVRRQLEASGYLKMFSKYDEVGNTIRGQVPAHQSFVKILKQDPKFANGIFYQLHRDVGDKLIDFRSYNGSFGKGSLQIVIDQATGYCYADVDKYSPYHDLVSIMGHAFGEVIPGFFRWLRKKR